jgi:hypothetical protein
MATGRYGTSGASTQAADAVGNRFPSGASSASVSEKEDLANFISMITRDETPFMSSIGKTKATGVYHEWQTDELAAPGNSRVSQGADFSAVTPDGRTTTGGDHGTGGGVVLAAADRNRARLGNYTQINAKTVSVSGTKRAVDQAGVADEYAYQLKKRGTEMRRDIESDLIHSLNIAVPGAAGTAGTMAGVFSWVENVINVASTDGSNTAARFSTAGITAAENGTGLGNFSTVASGSNVGELELTHIDQIMQTIYEAGGKATKVMLSPKNRRTFSAKAQAAGSNVRRNIDEAGSLRQAVDIYMSDFGDIMVEPNYIMGLAKNVTGTLGTSADAVAMADAMALVYDPMWFKVATLRPMQEVDVGQNGDSTVGMFVEECTLECTNPKAWGVIANIGA